MNRCLAGLLALILAGASWAQSAPVQSPALQTHAASVQAPAQPGWRLAQHDGTQVVFARDDENGRAQAKLGNVTLPPALADETFLARAERYKQAELDAWRMRSVHFNASEERGLGCLRYDGLFEDAAKPDEVISVVGILCPHPSAPEQAVEVSFEKRGANAGFEAQTVVDDFIAGWRLKPAGAN
jgi:hypothetical protein